MPQFPVIVPILYIFLQVVQALAFSEQLITVFEQRKVLENFDYKIYFPNSNVEN